LESVFFITPSVLSVFYDYENHLLSFDKAQSYQLMKVSV